MTAHRKLAASLAALAASACASLPTGQPLAMRPAEPDAAPAPDFSRQGRIQFTPVGSPGASASWDGRYVRGPAVNMTLTDEGLWGGTIRDRAVLLRAADGRITGADVNLYVTQDGAFTRVQGLWFGSLLRIDVSPTTLSASPTVGACGIELALADDGYWRGFGGCSGRLAYTWMTLEGVAGSMSREMPQWLFAFLASLPSRQTTVFPDAAFAGALWPGPRAPYLPAELRAPTPWLATSRAPALAGVPASSGDRAPARKSSTGRASRPTAANPAGREGGPL